MGLLDCVSDTRMGKYPVSPTPGQRPLVRGFGSDMGSRRSLGKKALFSSTSSIKGKDIDFWWNRVLCFLYRSEGPEDIRELRMPLKQLGYNSIGDFIRDIPPEIYEPFKSQIDPDPTLKKDSKVIWERDGISEPGAFKWVGTIEGEKCMGLQLDRKKAVPFRTYDGKGLFYCKPGHRALVPVDEVLPYKQFLRQFLGLPPRKDSMQLNLLPGRSSVRVAVAKKYKPGDRVHLPNEKKWATILWTGRIGGEWVVDLVYDPEKPTTGPMGSPDEPCMSRSLSMAEFIDQLGDPTTPPAHVPPPPPPPKPIEIDDEVFTRDNASPPEVILQEDGLRSLRKNSESDITESDEETLTDDDHDDDDSFHTDSDQVNNKDPGIESGSESEESIKKSRTFSEPVPQRVEVKKQELKKLDVFEPEPLRSRPTHKPLFNLASFGRKKKKAPKELKPPKPTPVQKSSSPTQNNKSPKKDLFFFTSRSKSKSPAPDMIERIEKSDRSHKPQLVKVEELQPSSTTSKEPVSTTSTIESPKQPSTSFFRRDRSRSPINKKLDKKKRWSGDHREVPIDVPIEMQSPGRRDAPVAIPVSISVEVSERRKSSSDVSDLVPTTPPKVEVAPVPVSSSEKIVTPTASSSNPDKAIVTPALSPVKVLSPTVNPVKVERTTSPSHEPIIEPRHRDHSSEESCTSDDDDNQHKIPMETKQDIPKNVQVEVSVEVNQPSTIRDNKEFSSDYLSDSTPPYSPVVKDVGFKISKPARKKVENKTKSTSSGPLKSLGSFFSPNKKKPLPPKDYEGIEENKPEPPIRKESLGDDSEDSLSVSSGDGSAKGKPKKVTENESKQKRKTSFGFGSRKSKTPSKTKEEGGTSTPLSYDIQLLQTQVKSPDVSSKVSQTQETQEPLGDQEGIMLDFLEVKDDQPPWSSPPPVPEEAKATTPKRRNSKGKTFSFGFSKKSKPTATTNAIQDEEKTKNSVPSKQTERSSFSDMSASSQENVKVQELTPPTKDVIRDPPQSAKSKRSSFKDSFTRTFSFSKDKRKNSTSSYEKLGENEKENDGKKSNRPISLYIDNNEAIGASTKISKPKSKSTSVLVDIQPWDERWGTKRDTSGIYDSPDEGETPTSAKLRDTNLPSPTKPVPALLPKEPEPAVPKHRIFTTPRSFFGFSSKSTEEPPAKPKKKTSFKGSKIPKSVTSPTKTVAETDPEITSPVPSEEFPVEEKPHLPKSEPPKIVPAGPLQKVPPESPGSSHNDDNVPYVSSAKVRRLKSALKQRKEIDAIPKGIKIGDRVIWYNGRIPIPGTVMKLYKDGTDKYTAVVKFDRIISTEPLSLIREGDAYIVTVEELITPEVFGIPTSSECATSQISVSPSSPGLPGQEVPKSPMIEETKQSEKPQIQTVRFDPQCHKPEPIVPEINIELPTPGSPKGGFDSDETIPPPFQEEEIDLACGVRRGIPSRDQSCCLETLLFSMFYTTNTFDISILYQSGFEEQSLTRDLKSLLRHEIVHPLRQSGFCEYAALRKLKEFMKTISPDFNAMSADAEIMVFMLFERALKLGKFISYSNDVTDYLHQLVLDPRDLSKSSTTQQLFETSLEHMEKSKLKTIPTPALILEIPRANDKLVHYEAVVPNLSLVVSHLLENGPRLCICGVAAQYECQRCFEKYKGKAVVFCDNCKSMADQIHFQLEHDALLMQLAQSVVTMDLVAVICVKEGHYTSFVKCGTQRSSPWLFYDGAEMDNPKVSLEQNLGMWIDRLEKYPGKYHDAFLHPLLTHFLANSHICIYQSKEKSSLV